MRRFFPALAAAALAAQVCGAIDVESSVAPGSPLIGTLEGESERSLLLEPVELREADGSRVVAATRLFRVRDLRYGFVLGVPAGTPPGRYVVRSAGEVAPVTVVPREFHRLQLPLDAALSDLLTRRDPVRDAENAELERRLAVFDADASPHADPFVMPVASFRRSSPYGEVREYLLSDGKSMVGIHGGVDLALPEGAPVVAAAAGRVVMARHRVVSGNSVVIEHMPGVYSLYYHLSEIAVSEGEEVAAGARLGLVGSTGLATGPHLHWEVRVSGVAVDPEAFVDGAQVPGHVDRALLAAIMTPSAPVDEGR